MARFLNRSRQVFAAGVITLLVGVVVLSAATRRPCLQVCSGSWHTSEAGRMITPDGHEMFEMPVVAAAHPPRVTPREPEPSTRNYFTREPAVPRRFLIVFQIRAFRSPPFFV